MSSNGKQRHIDPELISAFYDGETTAEERAAVEQWMDDSSDTLQTLDEYDQLSQSLKELHGASRSPDLREAVLKQIASQPPAPVAAAAASAPAVWNRQRVLSVVAGVTGLAAAITLLLWPHQPQPGDDIAMNEAGREVSPLEIAGDDATLEERMADEAAVAPAIAMAPTLGNLADSTADLEARVEMSLEAMARARPLPEVGDIVQYLDRNAEALTWVAVTVVDVQRAGDQVQLLLARHGVEPPSGNSAALEAGRVPGDPVAILVEADWNQLEAVIGDLSDEEFVNAMAVDAPESEGVPEILQGYAFRRTDTSDAGEDGQDLRMRVQARMAAAALAKRANRFEKAMATAVQLPANVPHADLERIAGLRGEATAMSRVRSEGALADRPAARAQSDPAGAERIGQPLASPRARAVFVIQKEDE